MSSHHRVVDLSCAYRSDLERIAEIENDERFCEALRWGCVKWLQSS